MKISAIVTTYNEEAVIERALKSLHWADELIVVDSFSTDQTVSIASQYARVIQHEYGYAAAQKNRAIPQASHDWVLILDADEAVSDELANEIRQVVHSTTHSAFWIHRQNYFMGKPVRYGGWRNDRVIRLFRKGSAQYEDKLVHEEMIVNGTVGYLNQKILHQTYRSREHFLSKTRRYAALSASDHQNQVRRVTGYHLLVKPAFRFFRNYVLKLGFLDGRVGFTIAWFSAYSVYLRYMRIRQLKSVSR